MNIHDKPQLLDQLAAAYALGVLKGAARRRFETHALRHVLVQRTLAEWQDRLSPLHEFAHPVAPRASVWQNIERRTLARQQQDAGQANSRRWFGLAFWRVLGVGSSLVAAVLAATLWLRQPEVITRPGTDYIATLTDDKSQTVIVVTGDRKRHQLVARVMARQSVAADRSLELWAVPAKGNPRSLGLVSDHGSVTLPLPDNATPGGVMMLAVSLEPKGGSPKPSGPTGPILFKGPWLQI